APGSTMSPGVCLLLGLLILGAEPGTAPGEEGGESGAALCRQSCADDSGCGAGEKCCTVGCHRRCPRSPAHPGVSCPIPRDGGTCLDLCSFDEECPWGQKCCSNGCGRVCTRVPDGEEAAEQVPSPGGTPGHQPLGGGRKGRSPGGPAQCHHGGSKSRLRAGVLLWSEGTQRDVEQKGALSARPKPHRCRQ
uniref:WAP domain-containing protein n=1 Tax=Anser brachyrhynchus TaxID=132585 RepID=A0A8B9BVL1_9AVES